MRARNACASARWMGLWAVLGIGAALLAWPAKPHAATFTYNSPSCTGFTVSGTAPNQTITCNSTTTGALPTCAPTVDNPSPSGGQTVTVTANCSNSPTTWVWTGGGCASKTTGSCQITKASRTTVTITVKATNTSGTGSTAQISISWK
ncbi:MAG TPA: hypothetical protein VMN79_10040 [Casimicrobiaceae bacterium]|nr:hypothetical protein [Casimicrobiaceae bacterium]